MFEEQEQMSHYRTSLKHVPLKDEAGKVIGSAEVVKVDDGERVTGRVTITDPELAKRISGPPGMFSLKRD